MAKSQKKNEAGDKPIEKSNKIKKQHNADEPKKSQHNFCAAKAPAKNSKKTALIALLQNPAGATIDEMSKAAGWQRHSVHGLISGVLRKKLKLTITCNAEKRGRVYRIIETSRI